MEMREVHLRDGTPTGRIVEKHAPRNPGEYFLHAVAILKTQDGRYVLQQRSLKARYYPGKWDVTGGGVRAGETTLQAAIRETYEEMGITANESDCRHMLRYVTDWEDGTGGLIVDMYAVRARIPDAGVKFDPAEVNAVKIVDYAEYAEAIRFNKTEEFMEAVAAVDALF